MQIIRIIGKWTETFRLLHFTDIFYTNTDRAVLAAGTLGMDGRANERASGRAGRRMAKRLTIRRIWKICWAQYSRRTLLFINGVLSCFYVDMVKKKGQLAIWTVQICYVGRSIIDVSTKFQRRSYSFGVVLIEFLRSGHFCDGRENWTKSLH